MIWTFWWTFFGPPPGGGGWFVPPPGGGGRARPAPPGRGGGGRARGRARRCAGAGGLPGEHGMTVMLEIADLHVAYGQVEAVRGVTLSLHSGQIVSLIGPNGAGKTTLLADAMGLLPARGVLRLDGKGRPGLEVQTRVERGLCLVPEQRELFGALSVLDNLQLGAYVRRLRPEALRRRLQSVYERFPRLAERRTQRADTLSGGERQMLALGRALMSAPRLLMLDEPSLGL